MRIISGHRRKGDIDFPLSLRQVGFASEIQLDNGRFVTTVKEVSSRVSFLGYLKFFK
jgi:hypothetical protein